MSLAEGPKIVDFSTHLSGPMCSHLLSELGATVIKVESPRHGDGNRDGDGETINGVGIFHAALNSGARSLTVDSRSDDWPRIVEACARWADAVVVGARPSAALKRGMDFDTMRRANPQLIYCALSGFGDRGPWKDLPAHGQTIDAYAGLLDMDESGDFPRTRSGWRTSGTTLAGVFAAMGVLAALNKRAQGLREAQFVDVSIWQTALWWSWRDTAMLANEGRPWIDYSDLGTRYSFYRTSDNRMLLLAPIEQRYWEAFCTLFELEELSGVGDWSGSGMCYGAGREFEAERELIADRTRRRTLEEWIPLLEAADVPFSPVLTVPEALHSEHALVNGVLRETVINGSAAKIPAIPVRFADATGRVNPKLGPLSSPPDLGEHNIEILRELGLQ